MYIEQVITACDTFYPNPYTKDEKYFWCDELSEMLTIKYNTQYVKSELEEVDGKYLLPEGVCASMLDKIICGDRVLKKQDFRDFGILCYDTYNGSEIAIPDKKSYNRIYAIYIKPYKKIRNSEFEGELEFGENCFFTDENIFEAGDILKVTIEENTFENIFVLSSEPDEESGKIKVIIAGADFEPGNVLCRIERKVTEKTVAPPPFDSMYTDYILGKICYYQNDFTASNNHMMLFNSKLADYDRWLKSHPVVDYSVSKLRNWW